MSYFGNSTTKQDGDRLVRTDASGCARALIEKDTFIEEGMLEGVKADIGTVWTKIEMGSDLECLHSFCYLGNGIVLAGSGSNTGDGDIYRSVVMKDPTVNPTLEIKTVTDDTTISNLSAI